MQRFETVTNDSKRKRCLAAGGETVSNDSIKENADWLLEAGVRSHRGDVTTSMDCAE